MSFRIMRNMQCRIVYIVLLLVVVCPAAVVRKGHRKNTSSLPGLIGTVSGSGHRSGSPSPSPSPAQAPASAPALEQRSPHDTPPPPPMLPPPLLPSPPPPLRPQSPTLWLRAHAASGGGSSSPAAGASGPPPVPARKDVGGGSVGNLSTPSSQVDARHKSKQLSPQSAPYHQLLTVRIRRAPGETSLGLNLCGEKPVFVLRLEPSARLPLPRAPSRSAAFTIHALVLAGC